MESRPFERPEDLRLMQSLAQASWRALGPLAPMHVGDLTWWMYQHLNKLDEVRAQLWLDHGECVAWAWLANGTLDFLVHPERQELTAEVVAWADADTVHTTEADAHRTAALKRIGYARSGGTVMNHSYRSLDKLPEPQLPEGYRLRTVRGEEDLAARVEIHRIVWAPSRVVEESYRRLMSEWPYRADLDHVVEAPDGSLAAFCLAWLDEENRVGLLEPVGTHPDHRRRGLAASVCLGALHGVRAAGAVGATVLSVEGSDAARVYAGIGFEVVTRHVPYGKKPSETLV